MTPNFVRLQMLDGADSRWHLRKKLPKQFFRTQKNTTRAPTSLTSLAAPLQKARILGLTCLWHGMSFPNHLAMVLMLCGHGGYSVAHYYQGPHAKKR